MSRYQVQNILAARNESQTITALDGCVGGYLYHQKKHYVITTPNQTFIPLPPIGSRQVRLRANMRYGLEDHCQWPQFLAPKYSHLPTIPKCPANNQDPLASLWWDPTIRDFAPSLTGIVHGLGTLVPHRLESLRALKDSIIVAVLLYASSSPKPSDNSIESTYVLQNRIVNAFTRLASLKSSLTEVIFNVTEFQRHYLHLDGFLRYSTTYRPRIDGVHRDPHPVDDLMGAFTMDAETAQRLFHAGVPVWYIEEWDGTPLLRNVLKIVDFSMPDGVLTMADHVPPFPTIYDGSMIGEERYSSIYNFSLTRLISQNPFARITSSTLTSSSPSGGTTPSRESSREPRAGPSQDRGSSSSSRQVKQSRDNTQFVPRAGRDPFKPIPHTHSPFSIPSWAEALEFVGHSRQVADSESTQTDTRYTLPDPKILLGSTNLQKYIKNWLQIRMIWQSRLGTEGGALLAQEWRQLLNVDLNQPPTGDSYTAKRRRAVYEKLIYTDQTPFAAGVQVNPVQNAGTWEGVTYADGDEVPVEVVRQILWSLYELNFHLEFVALDRCLTNELHTDPQRHTNEQLFQREMAIQRCFPTGVFKFVPIHEQNEGLAANRLEERLEYLVNFAKVVKSWPGCPEIVSQLSERRQPASIGPIRGPEFEVALTKFYCQSFWNQFRRAAQTPHRMYLPE